MGNKDVITGFLSSRLKNILGAISEREFDEVEEIRIRVNRPLMIKKSNMEYFITEHGDVSNTLEAAYFPDKADINGAIELLSRFSLYAFQEELRNGFITIEGGHRVGISGKTVVENGQVKTMKDMNGLNIRLSHEIKGCALKLLPKLLEQNEICHTLIISPPGCGKTTLLRDIARLFSNGIKGKLEGCSVGIVDERGEIAGCYRGIAQNDIGIRTDVLDACPKAEGMRMLVRSMAPGVVVVDEIGRNEDIYAIEEIVNAGVKLVCTIHGQDLNDVRKKPELIRLLEKKVFQRYVVLGNSISVGEIKGVFNGEFQKITGMEGG